MVAEHGCSTVYSEDLPLHISREDLQQKEILRVTKKNLTKKCLEMLAEIAELKDDYTESYEQFDKGINSVDHEDSTVGAKIAELLKFNASVSEDEQLNLKEYVDRTRGELNDMYSIIGESIAAVSSILVLGILRKKIQEVPQVQYIDKSIDVPGVRQGQVPTIQLIQKTVEVSQVQFLDRVLDAFVAMQGHASHERIRERTVEGERRSCSTRDGGKPLKM